MNIIFSSCGNDSVALIQRAIDSKPKFMFRPHRMQGAKGFKQVKDWANHGGGKYSPEQEDLFSCDSGFCGG